ncbi:uncharacterized protein BT62DRAFT_913095, partial [Guyanagaster necrorhizus]
INQLLQIPKTEILIVSKVHLTEKRYDELENLFVYRIKINFTGDPENSTGKVDVTIVLNKQPTLWYHIQTKVIVLE